MSADDKEQEEATREKKCRKVSKKEERCDCCRDFSGADCDQLPELYIIWDTDIIQKPTI